MAQPTPPPLALPDLISGLLESANPYRTVQDGSELPLVAIVRTSLDRVLDEVREQLGTAWAQGAQHGFDAGVQAAGKAVEQQLRAFYEDALQEQEAAWQRTLSTRDAEVAAENAARLSEREQQVRAELETHWQERLETARQEAGQQLLAEIEAVREDARLEVASLRERYEAKLAAMASGTDESTLAAVRHEAFAQGQRDAASRYDDALTKAAFERRSAADDAYEKGYEAGSAHAERESKAAYQEGFQAGLHQGRSPNAAAPATVSPFMLDEAKRQSYENGYEDGRSVGLARGRRAAEAEMQQKLSEAARTAYREGFVDGKRTGSDSERAWAFGILHLPPSASSSEVKQRYKRLSMLLHPDQNPTLGDEFIKNLNRARGMLEA